MNNANTKRYAFYNQPAQYLILDVGYPMPDIFLENTKKVVQNILCLESSSLGSLRVPCFGVSQLNNNFQPIIKLSPVRGGKCSKLLNQTSFCGDKMQVIGRLPLAEFKDFLHFAFVSALNDFQEYCNTQAAKDAKNTVQSPSQLQVTLITAKNGNDIHSSVESIVQNLNILKLKKIQIIQLSEAYCEEKCSSITNCNGFVELIKVNGSEEALENIFKTWLLDCSKDNVQVCIKLPGMMLKCDMVEYLVNVHRLSCASRLELQTDTFSNRQDMYNYTANELPIYELEIINRLSSDGLDESLLYGQPIGLIPTQCLLLNLTELQYNKQYFSGLCQSLEKEKEYLIAKVQAGRNALCSYFVLLPGPGMLLVKSIASKELVLPTPNTQIEQISQITMNAVNSCLSQIHKLHDYNASQFLAGLYTALAQSQKRGSLNNEPSTSVKIKTPTAKRSKTNTDDVKRSVVMTKYVKTKQVEMFTKPK